MARQKMKTVFISHQYKDNPNENKIKIDKICKKILKEYNDILPISPIHLFSFMNDEDKYRKDIMDICYKLIDICDEIWIYSDSEGCRLERKYAEENNKKILNFYRN
jgi:hypothetical protein